MAETPDVNVAITSDITRTVSTLKDAGAATRLVALKSYVNSLFLEAVRHQSFVSAQFARILFFIETGKDQDQDDVTAEEVEDFESDLYEKAQEKLLADHEQDIAERD